MTQGLATDQHSRLVQLPAGLVLPAGIDLALVAMSCPPVYPVIRYFSNRPGMALIDGRGILGPVAVNIGTLVDVLPHLFLCRRVPDTFHDLLHVRADDGAYSLPAALSVADVGKVVLPEHERVLEHSQASLSVRRQLRRRELLQLRDLRLDLRPGHEILPSKLLQLLPSQPCPLAELDQAVIIGLGEVLVPYPDAAAPFDILSLLLGGLKEVLVIRCNPVQLSNGRPLHSYRPGRKSPIHTVLQPLAHILPCLFQRGTFRVVLFDVLDKVFCVLPVAFVGIEGKYLISVGSLRLGRPPALPEGLHTVQPFIGLLMEILGVRLVAPAHGTLLS